SAGVSLVADGSSLGWSSSDAGGTVSSAAGATVSAGGAASAWASRSPLGDAAAAPAGAANEPTTRAIMSDAVEKSLPNEGMGNVVKRRRSAGRPETTTNNIPKLGTSNEET